MKTLSQEAMTMRWTSHLASRRNFVRLILDDECCKPSVLDRVLFVDVPDEGAVVCPLATGAFRNGGGCYRVASSWAVGF
jgi:hypothetical protein